MHHRLPLHLLPQLLLLPLIASSFAGCLPDLTDECGPGRDCVAGRCLSGVCVPQPADFTAPDQAPRADAQIDAALVDQGPPCVPRAEQCNNRDDDCDARIDEGPAGQLERPCYGDDPATRAVGQCVGGRSICQDGVFGACDAARGPATEFCNGVDDDCDGRLDEVAAESCYGGPVDTAGVGRCRAGRRACVAATASSECLDQVLPALEICDGADDDCDGSIDEGLDCACAPGASQPCYGGPADTEGVGRCVGGEQICVGALWGACRGMVVPGAERCNLLDDDCDGAVDEGLGGGVCRVGQGVCLTEGVLTCSLLGLRCDARPGAPASEQCNGLDDDCDGRTDEGFDRDAPCEVGTGSCRATGFITCDASGGAVCRVDPVLPATEQCNAIDDDCDGRIDEDAQVECYPGATETAGVGVCRAGARDCVDGAPAGDCRGAVLPMAEACDGRDLDCDGAVDEAPAACDCAPGDERACWAGPADARGVGQCVAGVQRCLDTGRFGPCEGEIGPDAETCDGVDQDCDGRIDEAASDAGRACVRGVGACAVEGRRACVAGAIVCDAEAGRPQIEQCNGADDDCDGVVDEGLEGIDLPCSVGQGACVNPGVTVCRAESGVVCAGEALPPAPEDCNAIDDDCDGVIDEGVRNACGDCAPRPPPDRCDGADNDCDGAIDEAFDPLVNTRCETGDGACLRQGRLRCGPGGLICASDAMVGEPEICNGVDDDCDGRIDNDAPCALPGADARCAEGQCVISTCADGFIDDDALAETGCERGCHAVGPSARLGQADQVAVAHAMGQTAWAWTQGPTLTLQIDERAAQTLQLGAPLLHPQPYFDGARWQVVGQLRVDGRLRAVRIDVAAQQITTLPGLDADPPSARFVGDRAAIAWFASAPDQPERVLHVIDGAAAQVFPLAGAPSPESSPAIIGAVDGLRLAVMITSDETARLQVLTVTADGALRVDAEREAAARIEGRLRAVRLGRNAVIAHVGDGAIWRYAMQLDALELSRLPPLVLDAPITALSLDRSAAGLMAVSVAPAAESPCALHLLRTNGAAVDLVLPAPTCLAASVAYTPDGVALSWIDPVGQARRAVIDCR